LLLLLLLLNWCARAPIWRQSDNLLQTACDLKLFLTEGCVLLLLLLYNQQKQL